jgi:hypothetical protein
MMSKLHAVAVAVALLAVPAVFAGDGDKVEKVKVVDNSKPVVVREEVREEGSCDKCHRGHVFTRFWVHTVGGTIGGGLKTGSGKISGAF